MAARSVVDGEHSLGMFKKRRDFLLLLNVRKAVNGLIAEDLVPDFLVRDHVTGNCVATVTDSTWS